MRRGYAALALLALIWGASFLFIKLAVRDMSPATVVLARALFGALMLALGIGLAGGLALLNDRGQATVASVPTVAATSFLLDRGAERMGGVQTPQVGCPETQVGLAPTPRPT